MVKGVVLAAVAGVVLTSCFGGSKSQTADTRGAASSSIEARTVARTCPVTLGNESVPPGATDWEREDSYGNGKLWTLFWPYNVVVADAGYVEKDGSIGMKWPWWRGVRGTLKIEGRRLDGKATPIRADISPDYGHYGPAERHLLLNRRVLGSNREVGEASLTFVTLVVKASSYGLELKLTRKRLETSATVRYSGCSAVAAVFSTAHAYRWGRRRAALALFRPARRLSELEGLALLRLHAGGREAQEDRCEYQEDDANARVVLSEVIDGDDEEQDACCGIAECLPGHVATLLGL